VEGNPLLSMEKAPMYKAKGEVRYRAAYATTNALKGTRNKLPLKLFQKVSLTSLSSLRQGQGLLESHLKPSNTWYLYMGNRQIFKIRIEAIFIKILPLYKSSHQVGPNELTIQGQAGRTTLWGRYTQKKYARPQAMILFDIEGILLRIYHVGYITGRVLWVRYPGSGWEYKAFLNWDRCNPGGFTSIDVNRVPCVIGLGLVLDDGVVT